MEINEVELRVRDLCSRLELAVDEQEIVSILTELRDALREHTEATRRLAFATMKGRSAKPILKRQPKNDTPCKAAD